jgi:hypothetical protein
MIGTACGQLFVVTNDSSGLHNCGILKYDFDGNQVNSIPLPNNDARGLAVSGTNLFLICGNLGTIAKYSTSGATINPALISGLTTPSALHISGSNLFVASRDYIGKYTTDGAVVNATLIANPAAGYGVGSYGLVIIGTNLYATYPDGRIANYTTDGAIVNETLVSGLSQPTGLATDGTNLFVANWNLGVQPGWVGKYTTSGSPIAIQLISGLNGGAVDLAINGTNLYVVYGGRAIIGKYNTLGVAENATMLTGGHYFTGIAALSPNNQPLPPPAIGITIYSNLPAVIWPSSGGNYMLETTTNLASGNWVTVSNYIPITGALITNASSPAFFRLR